MASQSSQMELRSNSPVIICLIYILFTSFSVLFASLPHSPITSVINYSHLNSYLQVWKGNQTKRRRYNDECNRDFIYLPRIHNLEQETNKKKTKSIPKIKICNISLLTLRCNSTLQPTLILFYYYLDNRLQPNDNKEGRSVNSTKSMTAME